MRKLYYRIALYALFVLILFSSNSVIIKVVGLDKNIKEVNFSDYREKDKVYYSVDSVTVYKNVFEKVAFDGWGFCDSDLSNQENRKMEFLLKSDNNCYSLECLLTPRNDVLNAFTDVNVPKSNSGRIEIYTLPLKSGEYELWMYIEESDDVYGLVNTGKKYVVENSEFKEYVPSIVENIENVEVKDNILYNIDSEEKTEDGINIKGWAFIENTDSANTNVYIEFTLEDGSVVTKECLKVGRSDVSTYFENELYNKSGFNVSVTNKEIKGNISSYRLILEYDGLYYTYKN